MELTKKEILMLANLFEFEDTGYYVTKYGKDFRKLRDKILEKADDIDDDI